MKTLAALSIVALAAGSVHAQAEITEVFTGLSGEDGTLDWIEVTNYGGGNLDTGTLWYDDSSLDISDAGNLDSIILAPGESAVFLIGDMFETAADDITYPDPITEFNAIWNYSGAIGYTNGGGNLGQGGDVAALLTAGGSVIDSLSYPSSGDLETFVQYPGESVKLSSLTDGVSYESIDFFNDNIGPEPDFLVRMVGSPGAIPTPGTLAMLGLAGLAGTRRRRA